METIYLHQEESAWEARLRAESYLSLYDIDEQPDVIIIYWHQPIYTVVLCPNAQLADRLTETIRWLSFDDSGVGPLVKTSCLLYTGTVQQFLEALKAHYLIADALV